MKKILITLFILSWVSSLFAQLGSEELVTIQELKNNKLYVYMKDRNPNATIDLTPKKGRIDYDGILKKTWDFCEIEFIDKDKYKELKKNKELFFLTNTVVPARTVTQTPKNMTSSQTSVGSMNMGSPQMQNSYSEIKTQLVCLSKGVPSASMIKKNLQIISFETFGVFNDVENMGNAFYFKLINNYLQNALKYNTAKFNDIAKNNAPNLRAQEVVFIKKNLKKIKSDDISNVKQFKGVTTSYVKLLIDNNKNPNQNRFILTELKNGTYNILIIIGPDADIYAYKAEKRGSSGYPRFDMEDLLELINIVGN